MEKIIQEIEKQIRELAQCEIIDTSQISELIHTRDRLKSFTITNMSQIQGFNQVFNQGISQGISQSSVVRSIRGGEAQFNSTMDGLYDLANLYFKEQDKNREFGMKKDIYSLITYHSFISGLTPDLNSETNTERLKAMKDVESLIMKKLKESITNENNTQKDIPIDVTAQKMEE